MLNSGLHEMTDRQTVALKSIPNTLLDSFDPASPDSSVSVGLCTLPGCLVYREPLA